MMRSLKYLIYSILIIDFVCIANPNNTCHLPKGCRSEYVYDDYLEDFSEKGADIWLSVMCDVNNDAFEFKFKEMSFETDEVICDNNDNFMFLIIFRWTSNDLNILDKRFNFSNVLRYSSYYPSIRKKVKLWNLKGFDVDIRNVKNESEDNFIFSFSNCRLDLYHNKKRINSCQDIYDLNITRIESIFQRNPYDLYLRNIDYNQNIICPLIFNNTDISLLTFRDMFNTFYKRNVVKFSNENITRFECNIFSFNLENLHDINLDLNILNPSILKYTKRITISSISSSSLNSIDEGVFKHLNKLSQIMINSFIFRKINHKQGITWIKQLNHGINVNLSGFIPDNTSHKEIMLTGSYKYQKRILIDRIFPDEDFCIYIDYPFNQLVILYECRQKMYFTKSLSLSELTCTYLWLIQYFENLNNLISDENLYKYYFRSVLNTTAFKSISKCNFEHRINLCNKSNYKVKDIWDRNDFFILNKKIQTAFKISLYPISLLGLITNSIVVLVILYKDNRDLFKEYKQYTYLWLNSLFCILISLIELLSWMTECFYPFEVFCPEIRKLVAIQFFKIIFHECFVTMFRFMCNFTYVAFALNRISLIGKDHGKIVTFMSEFGVKKYIGITVFISAIFSWIKGFKYKVNYFYPDSNFPMSNEIDIMSIWFKLNKKNTSSVFDDFYFAFNSISDLVNYLVFVVICMIIDICMVVQLRRTLEEKAKKSESINQKQNQNNKKAEFEEAVNKAIKMVVLNSAIGIFFKLPVCFIPLLNVFAQNFYKTGNNLYFSFTLFYSMLFDSDFYVLIKDMSHFLFTLSLSIQLFIYNRFDKKFQTGFQRLREKTFGSKNTNSSNTVLKPNLSNK